MTVTELQQKMNLKASSNMILIPQHWSFRGEYPQDKSEVGKLAWKLTDFIKRDGTVKIRRSSRENRMIRQRFRFKLRTYDNIYRDGKVRGEIRPLDFKIVDPAWTKKGVVPKLRKREIEFQKRFLNDVPNRKVLDIMIVQFRNEKVSNHGSIPITIDCNVVAFIVFEEGFHQPIKRTKQWRGHRWERKDGEKEEGRKQDGGAREHGRMSGIVITLARIEAKWC
ncbi:uncharacterized protein TNCV_3697411 [Trichonephila clavipes]|uniref:DUF382 domain-containing protein n=1 Tax=Trichonephila clavipes TaxID=2585209 RepID=A0A8X6SA97_TRICX|nr:uncharacterized protein TNCV_3697411 [Trichonephila clavipes]